MLNVALRPATIQDIHRIYSWRNDIKVRIHTLNPKKIDWKTHHVWYLKTLEDSKRHLFIAMLNFQPIGVLRLDDLGEAMEVSIFLAPYKMGRGYGLPILLAGQEWVKKNKPQIKVITAKVFEHNRASKNIFEKTGFTIKKTWFLKDKKGIDFSYAIPQ